MIDHYRSNLDNFLYWAEHRPEAVYLKQPIGTHFKDYTYQEVAFQISKIANYLRQNLDHSRPNHIGILSKNCAHWIMADLAIAAAGAVSVPFYPTLTADQLNQVLVHSDCQILFVGKLDQWESIRAGIPEHITLIFTPEHSSPLSESHWTSIEAQYDPIDSFHQADASELCTIIYTSGTTGSPKGVMLHHQGIIQVINIAKEAALLQEPNNRFISYLPLSHIAERNFVEFAGTASGGTIYFVETLDSFKDNLVACRPTHFLAVPRIWAKFREGILQKIGGQKRLQLLLSIPLLSTFIKRKIVKGLGLDQTKMNVTGAAPMPTELLQWFQKIGLCIQEAYGMTENMGFNSLMPRDQIRLGTVGKPWPTCEVKLDPESHELLMKAAYMTSGYYKEPTLTQELFDGPWLKTGDMAELDSEGFISIIGRVKDNFKTSKGQYVAPAPIENMILSHEWIEQACVVGTNLPQPIALIILNAEGKKVDKDILEIALDGIKSNLKPHFKKYEHLSKMVVLREDWTIENNCMTPTLKIRRQAIEKKFQDQIEAWNQHPASILFE
ncbi:AMP-binding protein [Aquirufa aurantiipilula]|uniref:AMP-binding protein n=1 Tax=Aquirufa aurantiipilula TaxID=2696561 RepID=UPI001CAA4854|nr:AMP-binding protein [Aquirufa aurantiipilula]MBZ1327529.1 AMP-binding protein [Aquirufa aurantiipilula]